ncbi:eukaryotic translation initiation factor 2-alpha kinase 3-like isoform X2 [Daphnia carinata]|uniref:eukaryotic translation initiation factor 2-alpha kinase 3-like isoform X2 n=1 Tax=Daphnia carinata TaxID=120202 RepID=UPI00257E523A|nr:eukaryotic translation initiation factor 2-alpha kinase 3-like isoform X2 [Daphnia carinata]
MGNPYLKDSSAKPFPFHQRRKFRGNMSFLPVPITTLDGGVAEGSTSLATSVRHQLPHVLLIECMLERMCAMYETDSAKQKELYDALRSYFITFRLLPRSTGFPGMDGVRLKISSDLNKLFYLAKHQLATSSQTPTTAGPLAVANSSPLAGSIWSSIDGSEHLFTSRYQLDFKEREFIAAGGFGVVYKAHNFLDNMEYAVKKILIGPRSATKVLREVHLLSQLHHPNIVAYKSAWLEYCPPQTLSEILRHMDISSQDGRLSSSLNISSSSQSHDIALSSYPIDSSSSDSIIFESETPTNLSPRDSHPSQTLQATSISSSYSYNYGRTGSTRRVDCRTGDGIVAEKIETQTNSSSRCYQSHREVGKGSVILSSSLLYDRVFSSAAMLLYIQMQLCPQTLRHWLNDRNQRKNTLDSIDLELSIFRRLVQGINYIHHNNIIHRDIKPENIFVDAEANQVLIGDFGLAVLGFTNEPNGSALSTARPVGTRAATRGVGTHTYAAPEQLTSRESYAKSDIYSLGIVLLELLNPFETDMERYKTIENLRARCEISEEVKRKWPKMAMLVTKMISRDRELRPSAEEIISYLDSNSPTSKTAASATSHFSKDELWSIIEDLRRQIAEKDLIIEALTKKQK